jgi:hypothetical protein
LLSVKPGTPIGNRAGGAIGAIAVMFLCYGGNAHAQTALPVKAPPMVAPVTLCPSVTSCTGAFWGGGLAGVGSNIDILGAGIDNSLFANGGIAFANIGYQLANGVTFLAAECGGGYQMQSGTAVNNVGGSNNGAVGWCFGEAGGNLFSIFGGSGTPPTNALLSDLISLYVLTGPMFHSYGTDWGTGLGLRYLIAPSVMLDIKGVFENQQSNNGNIANKNAQIIMAGFDIPFSFGKLK